MANSRAIVVLGMHRSGTSLLTRGIGVLGVYLGNNFCKTKPDNPTGYWENATIVGINRRLLRIFGIGWKNTSWISESVWKNPEVNCLTKESNLYIRTSFSRHVLWGFKDPRSIRLLPFWQQVLSSEEVVDQYLVVIRNPVSVVASLQKRQGMKSDKAYLLWLAYMAPYLDRIANRPFAVVDYDLFMAGATDQLYRIAHLLNIPANKSTRKTIENFELHFKDVSLRHNFSSIETHCDHGPGFLAHEAYLLLLSLAKNELNDSSSFWSAWRSIQSSVKLLQGGPGELSR